jgi:dTDP-4-dehydrorhamnose 3,5-epimerase
MPQKLIDGVRVKRLTVHADERGRLMEMLRADDDFFEQFGQAYLTTAYSGVVKAWHYHRHQVDHFTVVRGMMKIVLYDSRPDSPTFGVVNEFFAGDYNPILIRIPNLVYHGFKCISETEALVVNIPSRMYDYDDPDEYRLPAHTDEIPYDWSRKDA